MTSANFLRSPLMFVFCKYFLLDFHALLQIKAVRRKEGSTSQVVTWFESMVAFAKKSLP